MFIVDQIGWTDSQTHMLIELLGTVMSECSEVCWYAGWISNIENDLPKLVKQVLKSKRPAQWGHGEIDYETAMVLNGLSYALGGWVTYDDKVEQYSIYELKV